MTPPKGGGEYRTDPLTPAQLLACAVRRVEASADSICSDLDQLAKWTPSQGDAWRDQDRQWLRKDYQELLVRVAKLGAILKDAQP